MADGRLRSAWGRTSALMAMLANVNRDPKRRRKPYAASEFNPYHAGKRRPGNRVGKDISVDRLADELVSLGRRAGTTRAERKRNRRRRRDEI
jgi:hypothetical protein